MQTSACASSPPPPPPAPAPSTDTQAPSTPSGLAASNITQSALTLSWNPSTDNVQVTGYDLYRNGTKVASPSSPGASQSGLTCGSAYTFAVEALDAAGNRSSRASLTTSTSACSTTTPPAAVLDRHAGALDSERARRRGHHPERAHPELEPLHRQRPGHRLRPVPQRHEGGLAILAGREPVGAYLRERLHLRGRGPRRRRQPLRAREPHHLDQRLLDADAAASVLRLTRRRPRRRAGLGVSSATRTSASLSWNPSTDNVAVAGYRSYRDSVYQSTTTQPPTTISGLSCGSAYTFAVEAFDAAGNASNTRVGDRLHARLPRHAGSLGARGRRGELAHRHQHRAHLVCLNGQRRRHRVRPVPRGLPGRHGHEHDRDLRRAHLQHEAAHRRSLRLRHAGLDGDVSRRPRGDRSARAASVDAAGSRVGLGCEIQRRHRHVLEQRARSDVRAPRPYRNVSRTA